MTQAVSQVLACPLLSRSGAIGSKSGWNRTEEQEGKNRNAENIIENEAVSRELSRALCDTLEGRREGYMHTYGC